MCKVVFSLSFSIFSSATADAEAPELSTYPCPDDWNPDIPRLIEARFDMLLALAWKDEMEARALLALNPVVTEFLTPIVEFYTKVDYLILLVVVTVFLY